MTPNMTIVNVNVPPALAAKLDALVKAERTTVMDQRVTRSSVIRSILADFFADMPTPSRRGATVAPTDDRAS